MQSSGLSIVHAPRARAPGPGRGVGLCALFTLVGAFIAYMVVRVPVTEARLPREEVLRYWPAVALAMAIVAAIGMLTVTMTIRRTRGASISGRDDLSAAAADATASSKLGSYDTPRPLLLQRVPARFVIAAAVASASILVVAITTGLSLQVTAVLTLFPWIPLLLAEGLWKYKHYGFHAVFAAITLFQIGHLGEHSAQVLQLLMTDGELSRSHGVFGKLDFETVHFVWDTGIWLATALLLYKIGGGNKWLWISFVAASFHEIEHIYLFWLYLDAPLFYARGGFAGIMGLGGVIGSPLARPYMHFSYNVLVVVPMVVAFW
ncbi:MAG: hypothetical protein ACRDJI_03055, partial [Actinomycetota bacterium]